MFTLYSDVIQKCVRQPSRQTNQDDKKELLYFLKFPILLNNKRLSATEKFER